MRWPEERIREEFRRLDALTGGSGSTLPINFRKRGRSLAFFTHSAEGAPLSFTFTLSYFDNQEFSDAEALDVIRHEYAHYLKCIRYPNHDEPSHGPMWAACCRIVGAKPNRYYNEKYEKILRQQAKQQQVDDLSVRVFAMSLLPGLEICHPTFGDGRVTDVQPDDSQSKVTITFEDGKPRKFSVRWVMENCF